MTAKHWRGDAETAALEVGCYDVGMARLSEEVVDGVAPGFRVVLSRRDRVRGTLVADDFIDRVACGPVIPSAQFAD